jgi:tetratricopeptide (TPR) repeat protein
VLDAAAVAGVTVEVDLLREVVDEPVDDALERCFRLGLLDPHGDSVAFRHVIAWQTIRAHISSVRLTALDRRVLAALESDPRRSTDHARLALHAEEAGDHDAVVRHATAAAIEASRLAAHREAAAQYGRALRFAVGLPADVRADLLDRHSVECHLAGQVDRAIASRSVAVELWRDVGDRLRHGASLRWLAQLEWYAGRADEALAHGRLALDTLESIDAGPELAWAYALLAQLHMQSGADPATGLQLGTRAIALAEATGAHEARVHALCTVGAIEVNASDGAAIAHLEQSLALAKSACCGWDSRRRRNTWQRAWPSAPSTTSKAGRRA